MGKKFETIPPEANAPDLAAAPALALAPDEISFGYALQAPWCDDCVKYTPAETLYNKRRYTVELPNGEAATIRRATEDPVERKAILDLYPRLTDAGRYTRFFRCVAPEQARVIMEQQLSKYGPEGRVDIVASVDTVDEDGTTISKIIAHGGFFLCLERGEVVGEQHLAVDPDYAGHRELDPEKRAARKGHGLGTAMAQAIAMTAQGYDIRLVAGVLSENYAMSAILTNGPNILREKAGLPPLDPPLAAKYDHGEAYFTLPSKDLPDCTLCVFRHLGMLTVNCPARPPEISETSNQALLNA